MTKFTVLDLNKILSARWGIISASLLTPPHSFYTTFSNYFIVFFLAWSTVASVQFVMHNYDDLFLSLQTCAMIIGGIQSVAMYIGIGINSDDVTALHERLQSIVDEAVDDSEIYENYWRREQYCRTFTERVSRYTHLEQAIYVSAFAKSIFYLVTGNFDAKKLVLPYNLRMPFNTQTILGWYLFWFVCASMSFAFASILVPVTGYFVSCYHYIAAISEHIDILAASIDRDIDEAIAERNPYKTAYIYNKVHTTFSQFVGIHQSIYDVFNWVASMYSCGIFWLLPPMALFIAMTIYTLEYCEFDPVTVGFSIICVMVGLLWTATFCNYASHAIDHIEDIGFAAYNLKWYDSPAIFRKYIVLIIARSQEEINFSGWGMVYCNLEALGNIMNASISYYLIFRELNQL